MKTDGARGSLARRIRRTIRHYVFNHDAPPEWEGPVIRLEELTDAELADVNGARPRGVLVPSVHETWRCPDCRQWTMNGAHVRGRCNFCHHPRPPYDPAKFGQPRPGERFTPKRGKKGSSATKR